MRRQAWGRRGGGLDNKNAPMVTADSWRGVYWIDRVGTLISVAWAQPNLNRAGLGARGRACGVLPAPVRGANQVRIEDQWADLALTFD
jgi:hypothetical protein